MAETSFTPSQVVVGMRERVLRFITGLLAITMVPLGVAIAAHALAHGHVDAEFVVLFAFFALGPTILWSIRRWEVGERAIVHIVYLLSIATAAYPYYGLTMEVPPIFAVALVFAVMYYGRRGFIGVTAASVVAFLVAIAVLALGWVDPPSATFRDPSRLENVLRMCLSVFVSTLSVGALVGYLVHALGQAIADASEAMEREEAERVAREATEKALQQTQRLETVGRVAGGVAHDFNNALVVILGTAQLLQRRTDATPKQRHLADLIVQAAWRASEVSRQLLAFSRTDRNEPRDLVLSDWLPTMGEVLERLLPEDIAVEVTVDTDARIHFDPGQLEQVLFNLAINAHDAMPRGGTLSIRAYDAPDEGGTAGALPEGRARWVALEISDTGEGMEPEVLERIVAPLVGRPPAEGGRGLPVVRDIITEAGGRLEIRSERGRGTMVRLVVPTVPARELEAPTPTDASAPRILLAEDRQDVRRLMAAVLRGAGYVVEEAEDGTRACEVLASGGPFDFLCTDAIMPGTSVDVLIDRFRAAHPEARVMICSGHVEDEAVRRRVARGDVDFLAKPFVPSELLAKVASILARRESR